MIFGNIAVLLGIFGSSTATDSWLFNDVGSITLKSSANPNLCVRTEQFSRQSSVMTLIDCNLKYPGYKGDKELDVGEILGTDGQDFQLRVMHYPPHSDFGIFGCLFTGFFRESSLGVLVLTDACDYNDEYERWNFRYLAPGRGQLIHKKTGRCIAAPQIANGTHLLTANCNRQDGRQIWIKESL